MSLFNWLLICNGLFTSLYRSICMIEHLSMVLCLIFHNNSTSHELCSAYLVHLECWLLVLIGLLKLGLRMLYLVSWLSLLCSKSGKKGKKVWKKDLNSGTLILDLNKCIAHPNKTLQGRKAKCAKCSFKSSRLNKPKLPTKVYDHKEKSGKKGKEENKKEIW